LSHPNPELDVMGHYPAPEPELAFTLYKKHHKRGNLIIILTIKGKESCLKLSFFVSHRKNLKIFGTEEY
jgi:hypothetical protein